ncbi:MAG: arabinan endo-1,5-alpha-L-arabinosidase [Thermoguttaceae bacterium]
MSIVFELFLVASLLAALASPAIAADPGNAPRDVLFNCPDPAVIQPREDGPIYVFSTGRGVPIFRSDDLFHWKSMGSVFDSDAPAWAKTAVPGARGIWAPDIRWFDGRYYLYYAVSTFGSQRSVIGMAVNKTLDPSDADYHWEDRGMVLESSPGARDFNAIDPAMFVDRDNQPYLFWGSYWTGIKAAKLDPATGKLPPGKPEIKPVATRAKGVLPPAIEAPYVLYHDGNYYLFVSWDSCCDMERSTYKIIVGRSKSVLGPYLDYHGRPMSEGGGTLVLASYGKWCGPGHNSALCTSRGDWLILAGFDAENLRRARVLQVRRMYWSTNGWPVAGEVLSAPEKFYRGNEAPISAAGEWKLWIDFAAKESLTLGTDGKITTGGEGSWRQKGATLILDWKDRTPPTLFLEADGRCFVGRNSQGQVIFGQRIGP